jgi:low temperature requirement protein LtrA
MQAQRKLTGQIMAKRQLWQKPQLRTEEEEQIHRKVTWLELFFDLIFVVVVAELSHYLAKHVSLEGAGNFILLFLPVWWVWIGATYYNERFETEGLENRIFTFLQIIGAAGLAIFAHDGLGKTSVGFALSYVLSRSIITYLWIRGGYHDRRFLPTAKRFGTSFSISIACFVLSVFVPPPQRFVLWGIGLVLDVTAPLFAIRQQALLPKFSSSKLPERFGLFLIIVLGESVVAVVQGLAAKPELSPLAVGTGILALALAFGIWWIYFDFVARRPPKYGIGWVYAWNYLHMPLVIAVTATGAGILNTIANEQAVLSDPVRMLIAISVGISLTAIALLENTLRREADEPTHPSLSPILKLIAAVGALGLGIWGSGLGAISLLSLLFGLLAVQMIYGLVVWFNMEV